MAEALSMDQSASPGPGTPDNRERAQQRRRARRAAFLLGLLALAL